MINLNKSLVKPKYERLTTVEEDEDHGFSCSVIEGYDKLVNVTCDKYDARHWIRLKVWPKLNIINENCDWIEENHGFQDVVNREQLRNSWLMDDASFLKSKFDMSNNDEESKTCVKDSQVDLVEQFE